MRQTKLDEFIELEEQNKKLEEKVQKEIEKNRQKEQILFHQSKLASMGEMIGSIAHQWRQPLTQLSSVLVLVELKYERGKLTLKELRESIHQSQEQIEFMSKTIDDFRNFFKPNKQKDFFSPYKSVQSALSLISSSFENYNIKVNLKFEDEVLINGYESEFSQVILNILSNSKDAFIEKQIANPIITVTISKEDKNSKIVLCDNAGGINLTPIEKVFEPYVTTKHASSGTGIGLYMSKNIIEKSMNGSLSVSNNKNGVCFEIIL